MLIWGAADGTLAQDCREQIHCKGGFRHGFPKAQILCCLSLVERQGQAPPMETVTDRQTELSKQRPLGLSNLMLLKPTQYIDLFYREFVAAPWDNQ